MSDSKRPVKRRISRDSDGPSRSRRRSCGVQRLPVDLVAYALGFLEPADIVRFCETNRLHRGLLERSELLRGACLRAHGWFRPFKCDGETWLDFARRMHSGHTALCILSGAPDEPILGDSVLAFKAGNAFDSKRVHEWFNDSREGASRWRIGSAVAATPSGDLAVLGGFDEYQRPSAAVHRHTLPEFRPVKEYGRQSPRPIPPLPKGRCYLAAASTETHLLVAGGDKSPWARRGSTYRDFDMLSYRDNVWVNGPPMSVPRAGHGLVVHPNGRIYAAGGYDCGTHTYYATIESVDLGAAECKWAPSGPDMSAKRTGFGFCVGPDRAIYAVGGSRNGCNMHTTAERFDPRVGVSKWDRLADMKFRRGYFQCAFDSKGCLYAVGGIDDVENFVSVVERYDPRADRWESIHLLSPWLSARHSHALASICLWGSVAALRPGDSAALRNPERAFAQFVVE